jgi:predicted enzyme related to lactoylglutathione lyase
MSERDDYPAGVPCWAENLSADAGGNARFYAELLGWELAGSGDEPDEAQYFVGRMRGRDVAGVGAAPGPEVSGWYMQIAVEGLEEAVAATERAGGTVLEAAIDVPPAGRLAVLADPTGAVFSAWEGDAREGAQVVNEAGAWSMGELATPDPEAAATFYKEVFGWDAEEFAPGISVFRRPGYFGGEPSQPVPRDVVAVMTPGEGKSAWAVDFWVADAEATAKKAVELGGSVVKEPAVEGPFRSAKISDPQGGVLSVSELLAG